VGTLKNIEVCKSLN